MKNNIPHRRLNGGLRMASPMAIRIVKMLCPASPDSLIAAEALKVDDVMQLGAINNAMEALKQHAKHESLQRQEAQKRLQEAGELLQKYESAALGGYPEEFMVGLYKAGEESQKTMRALIWAMDEYIIFLHAMEKDYVLPHFLKADNPIKIYPDDVLQKAKELRHKVGSLTPAWLVERGPDAQVKRGDGRGGM